MAIPGENKLKPREKWQKNIQFLFGCCGFSVGLGNVWRFPYLCYRDGGGAFLIPYFISVLLGAIPSFMLEVALGQYTSQGAITAWSIVPLFKGIGFATQTVTFLANIYYNVILAWSFYYLFSCFTTVLPWSTCDNAWNTARCHVSHNDNFSDSASVIYPGGTSNISLGYVAHNVTMEVVDPATEFWQHKVLSISSGLHEMGSIKWDLALCLLLAWTVIYFCLWKGIKWTGKIMYVTVSLPYLFMLILLIHGVTLPGAMIGIRYYLIPDFSKLLTTKVWIGAATQVYFSYTMGVGALTALGSLNKFHHNFWRDGWLFAIINSCTSFVAGFVIFSILGNMSYEQNISIDMVADSGPGLAFIAYPRAVAKLPGAPVWAVLFFIMLLLLGLDSQFGLVESFIIAITDCFPKYLRRPHAREIFVAVICIISYMIGLSMVCNGGMYVFQIFDYYCQARIVICISLCQIIAIAYIYGIEKFKENIELMLGHRIGACWKLIWLFITPAFLLVTSIMTFYNYSHLTYNRTYIYPSWALILGWCISMVSFSQIPIVMLYQILTTKGSLMQRLKKLATPGKDIGPPKDMNGDGDENGDENDVAFSLMAENGGQ